MINPLEKISAHIEWLLEIKEILRKLRFHMEIFIFCFLSFLVIFSIACLWATFPHIPMTIFTGIIACYLGVTSSRELITYIEISKKFTACLKK